MELTYCQSCGMPLTEPELLGTNKDHTKNSDYCIYCFQDGAFTQNISMEEMIANCVQFLNGLNNNSESKITNEVIVAQMREYFPQLKRWRAASENK